MSVEIYSVTKDMANKVVELLGLPWIINESVFYDYTPKDPDNIISITEYMGSGVAQFTNTSVRSIQFLIRNTLNSEARNVAWQLYDAIKPGYPFLDLGVGIAITGSRDTPFRLETDHIGRNVWVFNMGITYNYKKWNPEDFI